MIEKNKTYVVTGGYGFLGTALIREIINGGGFVRTIGKNETKLLELKETYGNSIEIIVGDIKNIEAVNELITENTSGVFHLAAFKYVGAAEKNVLECVNSNVIGTINILCKSTESKVNFVMGVTGAAAVQVSGTYGATKMLTEKLFFDFQKENDDTKFRILRYGNIMYSTGSVLCKWRDLISNGEPIMITDGDATRFFSTIDESIQLIHECIEQSKDFEPYVPKLKAIKINDLLRAMIIKYKPEDVDIIIHEIGLQLGENKHEKVSENGLDSSEAEQFTINEILKIL